MSLISKDNLSLTLKAIKKLLSFKADKSELATKIDRSEIEEIDAIEIAADMGLVSPITSEDGSVYIDENGVLYSL